MTPLVVPGAGFEPAQSKTGGLQPLGLTNAQPRRAIWHFGASIALSIEHRIHVSCDPEPHAGQIPDVNVRRSF